MSPRRLWPLVALLLPGIAAACPLPLPELPVVLAGRVLTAELAQTPAAQACGLSHRDRLAADRAMLFAFPGPVSLPFWMKDTRIPLSIAFLDKDGHILALADMTPGDIRHLHRPPAPYRYALETVQGWFARHRVKVGDRVHFDLSQAHDAAKP